ncbi:MAG TPA: hypothetical protein VFF04_05215, partial [Candidatus Babeliales bacterium]|nr:hypothetical protein [Candidatus Babeliales bacterium]
MLTSLLSLLDNIFGYLPFLYAVTIFSFALKSYILAHLFLHGKKIKPNTSANNKRPWIFLILVLISSLMIDFAWIMSLSRQLWLPNMDPRLLLFPLRISWGFFAIQYQSLALFMESLIAKSTRFNLRQKLFIAISSFFFIFCIGLAVFNFNCQSPADRPEIEFLMRTAENIYLLTILMPVSFFILFIKIRSYNLPGILRQQLRTLIPLFLGIWIADILQVLPLPPLVPTWTTNSYSAACITTILISLAVFFCTRRVMELRFLNFTGQVQSKVRFNFIDGFKDVLEQLSHATSAAELRHITQTLFKEAFHVPVNKTKLYFCTLNESGKQQTTIEQQPLQQSDSKLTALVENFINTQPPEMLKYIAATKIFIFDEVAFTNFYENDPQGQIILQLLDKMDAEIFLPIYEKQAIIAYIIVERHARPNKFYGHVEHDEMLVFASYLANIINLLQTRNLKMLMQQEKELREELYLKHQEINQYKESIRSFLRTNQQKEIGILFYKNRHFIIGNKAAKELIHVNVNTQEGHPLVKVLKQVARQVEDYKIPYSAFAHDREGNKLVLAGVPNLEQNNVIITVYYPDISDIIKKQLEDLHNPSKWDYLLYLETTNSGKLINQLIPGSGEKLLNFKISLLEAALSKKAILLEMPEEDLLPTVEIIHH